MRFKEFYKLNENVIGLSDELKKKYNLTDVRLYEKGNGLILDMIVVPKGERKSGIGSKVMSEIVEYADSKGLRILLTTAVKDDYHGTTSMNRLKLFYKKFGFVENKGRYKDFTTSHNMIREPKKKLIKESFETDYKKFIAYHQTSKANAEKIKKSGFNFKNALQKIVWFTSDIQNLKDNFTGASESGVLLKLEVKIDKAADWDLYEKKTLDELFNMKYDGVILKNDDGTFDGFTFYPNQIKVLEILNSVDDIRESKEEFPKYGIYSGIYITTKDGLELKAKNGIRGSCGVKIDKNGGKYIVTYADISVCDHRENEPYSYPPIKNYIGKEIKLENI